jgi:hypothetical protein
VLFYWTATSLEGGAYPAGRDAENKKWLHLALSYKVYTDTAPNPELQL